MSDYGEPETLVRDARGCRRRHVGGEEIASLQEENARLESYVAELHANLSAIAIALDGQAMSEFAETLPHVRKVVDVKEENARLKEERDTLDRARYRWHADYNEAAINATRSLRDRAEEAERLLDEAEEALEEWWCESGTKGDVLLKLRARKEGKDAGTR